MMLVPNGFEIPQGMTTEHLRLRMLVPDVTNLDYDALMESRLRLRKWSDSGWPADDFTLAGNRADLEEHEREFRAREAFAYTVLSPDEAVCEGCVYINPLDERVRSRQIDENSDLTESGEHAAAIAFWVRDSALERDLDRELLDGLIDWLQRDWPFADVYFFINASLDRDQRLYRAAGLEPPVIVPSRRGDLNWEFWRMPDRA